MTDKSTVGKDLARRELLDVFGPGLEFERPLAPLTSYQTGGPARYFLAASEADSVSSAIASAKSLGLPCFVMGGGSNLLVSDEGFDGLVIRVDVLGLEVVGETDILCGAGESLQSLVDFATEQSLTGLEFAAGIWGAVGGAIYGNAGAFGGEIGAVLTELTLVTQTGEVKTVDRDYCRFAYRDSYLKTTRDIVVRTRFHLTPGDREVIASRVKEILALRDSKHPSRGKSAGCFFKNILAPDQPYGKLPAGKLLEESGAKDLQVGGAKVFEKHANIIVNTGSATSSDIRRLADLMKDKVRRKFDIELEEEVIQLGRF
jgi:UDP-N-acetylmuramate dehydrogenase